MTTADTVFNLPRPLLLDGGMGRELRFRGVPVPDTIWSAGSLMTHPEVVREIHRDYILAGADVITTNTYGVIAADLEKEQLAHRFDELNILACELAVEARAQLNAENRVLIAGSLPPLRGSYRPDLVGPLDVITEEYRAHAALLAPYVDFYICETMSSAVEGLGAARGALTTGKPVWVSWTLHEDRSGRLRSEESIGEAVAALDGLPISGMLANCCAPESITSAMPALAQSGASRTGGYANTFTPVPVSWTLSGGLIGDGLIGLREDLGPDAYSVHAQRWLDEGASVIGGCCGCRPAHIAKLRQLLPAGASAGE